MDYNIVVDGLTELITRTNEASEQVEAVIKSALDISARKIQAQARTNLDPHHRTGTLQRSILYAVDYPQAQVTVNEKYGIYIEQGTKAHDIYPKNRKALFWKGALYPVKVVHHPGTRADPFFQKAIEQSQTYIKQTFINAADSIIRKMAGL